MSNKDNMNKLKFSKSVTDNDIKKFLDENKNDLKVEYIDFDYSIINPKNLVGVDEFGSKYYSNSKRKRWVIYKNKVESSKIPPEWHLWIHFLTNNIPSNNPIKFKWQKKHEENLTGTTKAHKPDGSLTFDSKKNMKKYETWKF